MANGRDNEKLGITTFAIGMDSLNSG